MGREKGFVGHWNKEKNPSHVYTRKSVETDVQEFCGWRLLIDIVEACGKTMYYSKPSKVFSEDQRRKLRIKLQERDQELVATAFESGGRITEVLKLRRGNIAVEDDHIIITGMRVIKRYEKEDEYLDIVDERPDTVERSLYHWSYKYDAWVRRRWKTKEKFVLRGRIAIPMFEPLAYLVIRCAEKAEDYLFPTKFKRKNEEPHIDRGTAYKMVNRVGKELELHLYDHWFRAQRASQLAQEYGWRNEELKRFFSWEEDQTPARYAKLAVQDLTATMTQDKIRL